MNKTRREVIKLMLFIFCIFTVVLVLSKFIKKWTEEKLFEEMVRWVKR